jgi:hypothetical protein
MLYGVLASTKQFKTPEDLCLHYDLSVQTEERFRQ